MKKVINNYRKWNPSLYAITILLLMPFVIFISYGFKLNNDFWFLVNTGKIILKEGFIHIEPFTIHSGLFFLPQQWLVDIFFNLVYSRFGISGMYCLILLCNAFVVIILYKLSFLICNNKKQSVIITFFADVFLIITEIITTRPQVFDVIIFSLELFLIESYIKKNKVIYLVIIPFLSIVLINCHASMWMMFYVLMVPYYVEYFVLKFKKNTTYKIKPLVIITIISLFCGFINPYGIEAIKYFFNSYGDSQINNVVSEMNATVITDSKIIYAIIFFFLYSFYHNKGKNKLRYFLLCIGIVYLTLCHYRGILYLGIISPVILGYNFKYKNNSENNHIKTCFRDKIFYISTIVAILILLFTNVELSDGVKIKEFADYLDKNATHDIKLFTSYDDGSYMEYRGYKCYIDPRAEVFLKANNKKEDIFDEYYQLDNCDTDIEKFLNKYQFDYLLVDRKNHLLLKYLQNSSEYVEVLSKETDKDNKLITYLYKKISGEKRK